MLCSLLCICLHRSYSELFHLKDEYLAWNHKGVRKWHPSVHAARQWGYLGYRLRWWLVEIMYWYYSLSKTALSKIQYFTVEDSYTWTHFETKNGQDSIVKWWTKLSSKQFHHSQYIWWMCIYTWSNISPFMFLRSIIFIWCMSRIRFVLAQQVTVITWAYDSNGFGIDTRQSIYRSWNICRHSDMYGQSLRPHVLFVQHLMHASGKLTRL